MLKERLFHIHQIIKKTSNYFFFKETSILVVFWALLSYFPQIPTEFLVIYDDFINLKKAFCSFWNFKSDLISKNLRTINVVYYIFKGGGSAYGQGPGTVTPPPTLSRSDL